MANGDTTSFSLSNGSPWWAKFIAQVGVFAALSLGLIWFITQSVDQKLDTMLANQELSKAERISMNGMMEAHADSTGRVNAEVLFYLRALCVQGARSSGTDPRECVPPR
jgi:negative regulator of sigma E activity